MKEWTPEWKSKDDCITAMKYCLHGACNRLCPFYPFVGDHDECMRELLFHIEHVMLEGSDDNLHYYPRNNGYCTHCFNRNSGYDCLAYEKSCGNVFSCKHFQEVEK